MKGLDSGADDFIRQPVDVEEVLARGRSLLRLKHSVDERDAIARQREDFVSRLTHDLRTPSIATARPLALTLRDRRNHNLLEMVNTLLAGRQTDTGLTHSLYR